MFDRKGKKFDNIKRKNIPFFNPIPQSLIISIMDNDSRLNFIITNE